MTGPEEMFAGFDDPDGVPGRLPDVESVVARGRHLRARRYAAMGASAAAVIPVVAVAAFAAVPGLDAGGTGHSVVPASNPTANVTGSPHGHGAGTHVLSVVPGAVAPQQHATHHPTPPPPPAVDPCAPPPAAEPAAPDPSTTDVPSPAPSPSVGPCHSPTPTPSASITTATEVPPDPGPPTETPVADTGVDQAP